MLVNRKDLVKVSRAPGKTQTLNFFLINRRLHFVDLPGYGYAKVSRSLRHQWSDMISHYLRQRKTLHYVFILVDARLDPQQSDIDFVNQLGEWRIPFAIIFTKSDKVGKSQVSKNVGSFHAAIKPQWSMLPETFITSIVSKAGKDDLLKFIEQMAAQKTA